VAERLRRCQPFRSIGLDFNSSLDIVDAEINPAYLPNIWQVTQDLPARGLDALYGDGFAESQHQQWPVEAAYLSNTPYQHSNGSAREITEFGSSAMDSAYSDRNYRISSMSVDVSRLIHGEYRILSATPWQT
jgi:hypothetical protein